MTPICFSRAVLLTAVALATVAFAQTTVEGRYIVKLRDVEGGKGAVEALGGRVLLELGPQKAVAASIPEQALEALRQHGEIEYVEVDAVRSLLAQTTPYGIPMVQADLVSDAHAAGRKICVIDSGLYASHEDHSGNPNVQGTNVTGTGNWFEDTCGHGTHVAGTIAAVNNAVGVIGVLPNQSSLHIIKVFDGESCGWAYSSTLVNALNHCVNAGATIVSMSLGGSTPTSTESSAFQTAYDSGMLLVAAAGNGGSTQISYPAGYPSVISVAAIDSSETVAAFSQKNADVELAAPGVGVLSTIPWKESNTATAGGVTYAGTHVDGSGRTTSSGVSANLVNGGLCTSRNNSWSGKVVLCQRGSVTFATKVNNVARSKGKACIIYNNIPGPLFATLDGTARIPAIGLSDTDGAALLAQVGQSATVVSFVTKPGSGYEAWDGTSMATPAVSAVAALVWSYNPAWSNQEVRDALTGTAKDLGAAGRDTSYGFGLVQAQAAKDRLCSTLGGGYCP